MTKKTKDPQPVAYHEAGHAVTARTLDIRLRRKGATIIPDEDADGAVWTKWSFRGRPDAGLTDRMYISLQRHIIVLLAGVHAQREYRPSSVRSHHGDSDRKHALDMLSYLTPEISGEEFTLHFAWLDCRAKNIVKTRWPQITVVANALLARRKLTSDEVMELVDPGMRGDLAAFGRSVRR